MDKCCRTCKWFRSGVCKHPDMITNRDSFECAIGDAFGKLESRTKEIYIIKILETVCEAVMTELSKATVSFIPADDSEFHCCYYE